MQNHPPAAAGDFQPITRWLHSARDGIPGARSQLYDAIYPVLYRMAAAKPGVRPGASLSPTVVVNELFLKITDSSVLDSADREHFFAACSRAMRFITADFARAALAIKRGGEAEHCLFTTSLAAQPDRAQELLDIHNALDDLDRVDPSQRELVELKFFGGLTHAEIGQLRRCSERTVKRDWVKARAFLLARTASAVPGA